MIYHETRTIPIADVRRYQDIIDSKVGWLTVWPDDTEVIEVLSVDFGNGWEIDINIVKGEPTPYVDAILFEHGCEVYAWEISESLIGELSVVLSKDEFHLEIFAEKE